MNDFNDLDIYSMSLSNFEIMEKLGEGSIGEVYLAEYKPTSKLYALKFVYDDHVQTISKSLAIATNMIHPNLLRCYGYFYSTSSENKKICICILEFIQGQDLYELFLDKDGSRPFEQLPDIIRQVSLGLEYIHRKGYVHRDIKVENILVSTEGVVKIIDYDFIAKRTFTDEINGTPYYLAPEIISISLVSPSNDMWALGVSLYLILTNMYPFDPPDFEDFANSDFNNSSDNPADTKNNEPTAEEMDNLFWCIVNDMVDFTGIPSKYLDLIQRLLRKDHRIRLSSSQLVSITNKWLPSNQRISQTSNQKKMKYIQKSRKR